ncbi:MAG: hypothetical protein OXI96_09635 [Acidimicrobiaceae bacterium]|nr:hypothetical protein [Acidimicrobiaceae bacterium]
MDLSGHSPDDGDNPMSWGDEVDSSSDTKRGGGSRSRAKAAVRAAKHRAVAAAKAAAKGTRTASKATKHRAVAKAAAKGTRTASKATKHHTVATAKAAAKGAEAAASVVHGVVAGVGAQINQVVQSAVSGSASVYDKALDAKYLDPLLRADMGGSYHRLFDGGHTIAGAVRAVNETSIDDTLTRQTLGTVEALLRDVSTVRGLPLSTWDKATFDSVAQTFDSSLGIPKRWLYDINTFDAGEVLGATVGVVAVALNWNRADTEQFAQVVASMGLPAAVGLNPLLLLVTAVAAAQSFNKARSSGDYSALADGAFRGGATSAASLGAVSALVAAGGPAGAGLLAGMAAGVLVHQTVKNVSVTEITGFVKARAAALAPTVAAWAQDVLGRDDADPADRAVAQEILALPSVAAATAVANPIVGTLNEALAGRSGGASLS